VPTPTIAEILRRRVRERGAEPLVTYYDLGSGERTELSAATFANWVNKTANLLVDALGIDVGDQVELSLAESHPGNWVTLIWTLAGWQTGAEVTVGSAADAAVLVVGPDTGWATSRRSQVVYCPLHPLGLPGPHPGPGDALDYNLEVRGQADQFPAVRQPDAAPAWRDRTRRLTQAQLVAEVPGSAARRLVVPTDPWTTVREALLTPLLTGGSTVIVTGDAAPGQLGRIAASERVDG
jgi:uncharacterized protein (TIGR03089 family)